MMSALIRCCCHLDPKKLNEDEFIEAYEQAKYFLSIAHQVTFT